MTRVTVVGDCLLDRDVHGTVSRLTPDGPAPVLDEAQTHDRPGGAGLAALLARRDGHHVTLVTALSHDDGGSLLRRLLHEWDIDVIDLGMTVSTPWKIRLRTTEGVPLARLDRGGRADGTTIGPWLEAADRAVADADAVLVSCYGRGVTEREDVRAALARSASERPMVWDPHPRGSEPVPHCTLATPNRAETRQLVPEVEGDSLEAVTARANRLAERWESGIAVTLAERGALLARGDGPPLVVPAPIVDDGDPCGAGDRLASAAVGALARGCVISEAITAAVHAASWYVADGGPAALTTPTHEGLGTATNDAFDLAERVRRQGGTVVATGGCFDILHAGHVQLLASARALGDCLIVCLNSDRSVRALKGPSRPVVSAEDRAEVLRALDSVDAVAVFDEDTPTAVLERLRPDVFVKGDDYGNTPIPEADLVRSWGGQAVTVPYLEGRSTTQLLQEVMQHVR